MGVDVPVLLARWRSREIARARRFRESVGAGHTEIEDIYDATVTALLERSEDYQSEEHLRNALHYGIKVRALNLHRDRRTHTVVLERAAPLFHSDGQDRAWRAQPERAAIAREDDELAGEFIAELDQLERQVFALMADGRSWRAIATALSIPETRARSATRSCERKRKRFVTLYSTGRLCGYRSTTIGRLLAGQLDSEQAYRQARAHLRRCAQCRRQHRISAVELEQSFGQRIRVLLPPLVVLPARHWLRAATHAIGLRAVRLAQRCPTPQDTVHERVIQAAAGTGAGVKIAACALSVAVIAGGAVGISGSLEGHTHHHRHVRHSAPPAHVASVPVAPAPAAPRRSRQHPRRHRLRQRTPGRFSYLGVPAPPPRPASRPARPVVRQHGGGPFSP